MAVFEFEDAGEDGVDVGELALEVEGSREFFGAQELCDCGVGGDEVAEDEVVLPGVHGVLLKEAVGVFARHAGFGEIQQELAAED